jgi:magnesium-transporting ATPase (P-type)
MAFHDSNGNILYSGSSPDEQVLVEAARNSGISFNGISDQNLITIKTPSYTLLFQLLASLDFDSTRKRMSVLLRDLQTSRILLYSKGADEVLTTAEHVSLREHVDSFAREGLRTLVYGRREVSEEEYKLWIEEYQEASADTGSREAKKAAVARKIEQRIEVLGATGVEDALQEKVPETIAGMKAAGMRVWVLTGDKVETAVKIAHSCKVMREGLEEITITVENNAMIRKIISEAIEKLKDIHHSDVAIIVTGSALT